MFLLQKTQRGLGIFRQIDVITILQRRAQSFARRFLIVDDQ